MKEIKKKSIYQKKWRDKRKKELGIENVYRIYTEEEKKRIRKMRSEGFTYSYIAKKMKGKISTIAKIAKDVELRPEFQRRVAIAEKKKIIKTS